MIVCESARLTIRELVAADAQFVAQLLTQPSWLQFIGDRGVRNLEEAGRYIAAKEHEYATLGYGMYAVQSKKTGEAIGLCGLVKRPGLPNPDIGFALLESCWGQGYAMEAASAVVEYALTSLSLPVLLAITTQDNVRSDRLLQKLGFRLEDAAYVSQEGETLRRYAIER